MYINKKSIPKEWGNIIDYEQLQNDLIEENNKNADWLHYIKHNDLLVKLEMTYKVHKNKGMEWIIKNIDFAFN